MNWLRIAQGVLCAVEVCGLYFLISLFFRLRFDRVWSRLALGLTGILICSLTICQREVSAMYSRLFLCFYAIFLSLSISIIILIKLIFLKHY